MPWPPVQITLPPWVDQAVTDGCFPSDDAKMQLVVRLSRENVLRGTGGPFGAAIFERLSGRLVGVGVNSVVRLANSSLHAEMMAYMIAQARLQAWSLAAPGLPEHELVTSCEPCAMCLGAVLWSGVKRVVSGATREDAIRLQFEEGPVFPESWQYLEGRGVEVVRGVLREEARGVLELYRKRGGEIYNR